ncbi:competence/damage-inducible protein A [Peptoniphilus sp. KCTC 25270]|uniref:competence/damage-inducible protein A n=1 Tax=Peptoniphilus sp. KCTC 25270 TaxID=2897414 RepID=UPI001E37F8DD|nr:competence/damage-inducible protein A [Peptoniphilus sp. KCTC 25270]MCD1147000.1 competence/damage-inducible protein A [Peptoniphilus sp. KCTC 25270]
MKAEIITVGTELLIGNVIDSNSVYLSRRLTELGIDVRFHTSVRDNREDLYHAIQIALERCDYLFLAGGLGPTDDDLTKEVLAEVLGKELLLSDETWELIKKRLEFFSKKITPNNKKQALYIDGSYIIPNPNGSAPGEYIEMDHCKVFLLPGPPKEFEPMADGILDTYFKDIYEEFFIESLNLCFIGESQCEEQIRLLKLEKDYLEINTFAKTHEVEIKIIANASAENKEMVKHDFEEAISVLKEHFQDYIYAIGQTTIPKTLVSILREKGKTICFAESVTCGLLPNLIGSVPGASDCLKESFVVYSNESKVNLLKVNPEEIGEYSVVSQKVASSMSKGAYELSKADFVISTTGEAGPTTSSNESPGTVCYSIRCGGEEVANEKVHFLGNREEVRLRAAKYILGKTIFLLKEE